jgi:2,4-dienoyl-CoA reductase-like NADH-dependent reductase (Old Yellow Enzyme family)/thioredoxin reductase
MTPHGPRLPEGRYLEYLAARAPEVGLVGVHAGYGMGIYPPGPGRGTGTGEDPAATPLHPLRAEGRQAYERYVAVLREQAAVVQAGGARCVGQLHHAGGAEAADTMRPPSGPSDVPDPFRRRVPHPLSLSEIADLIEVYAEAAGRAQRAGLDMVEIHAGHGYLLNQFLSPLTNRRTDRYGGSRDNRLRLLLEVLDAVTAALDGALPVGVRIPGSEPAAGGLTVSEMCEVGTRLVQHGAAYLSVSNGTYTGFGAPDGLAYVAPAYVEPGPSVADAGAVRSAVGAPVLVTGRLVDPEHAAQIVAEGAADLVGFTRALIADPKLISSAASGRPVRHCIGCNECHTGIPVRCTVNPRAGWEGTLIAQPGRRLRVVVVGAGPAGVEAALWASRSGHRVTLFERGSTVGGTLALLALDPARPELARLCAELAAEVSDATIDLQLEVEADAATIAGLQPDDVVVAAGADEVRPDLPGLQSLPVATALEVLAGQAVPGPRVAVVGGSEDHLPPLVTADLLARQGLEVFMLTEQVSEGEAIEAATRRELLRRLRRGRVTTVRLAALSGAAAGQVEVVDPLTGEPGVVADIDAVVLACGRHPRTELAWRLGDGVTGARVHQIGDCLAPRRLLHAFADGARLAASL